MQFLRQWELSMNPNVKSQKQTSDRLVTSGGGSCDIGGLVVQTLTFNFFKIIKKYKKKKACSSRIRTRDLLIFTPPCYH